MTITANDIKILASERFNDDADGGGYMTSITVQDGVENNAFPDINSIDRAQGAIDMRKLYPAVLTSTTESYLGAHVLIDKRPGDPAIGCVLAKAANVSEVRSQFVSRMNAGTVNYYGTRPLTGTPAALSRSVVIAGLSEQLIPVTNTVSEVSGQIVQPGGNTGTSRVALVSPGGTVAVSFAASAINTTLTMPLRIKPGTATGGVTRDGSTFPLVETVGSTVGWAFTGAADMTISPVVGDETKNVPGVLTACTITYEPYLPVTVQSEEVRLPFGVGSSVVQVITLPFQPEDGSEEIEWMTDYGTPQIMRNNGQSAFYMAPGSVGTPTASVDRALGKVTVLLDPRPKLGTEVIVRYVRRGFIVPLGSGALSGGFVSGQVTVTPSTGFKLRRAYFKANGVEYELLENGTVVTQTGTIVGAFDQATGTLSVPGATGAISNWLAVQVKDLFPTSSVSDCLIGIDYDSETVTVSGQTAAGTPFTATANSAGTFSTALVTGTYSPLSGKLNLTFSEPIGVDTLQFTADKKHFVPSPDSVTGLNSASYPASGAVRVIRKGDVVVVHHTDSLAPQTVTNGQTVSVGRTLIAEARVFGNDGAEITTGFTVNRTTGQVTFSSTAGYSQPVTITHSIEDMSTVIELTDDGTATLSRPLAHSYPAGSFISSALVLGDLMGRVRQPFSQTTWTGVWSDTRIGDATLAVFNNVLYPIAVTNRGSITERWLIRFTNTTQFTVTGEQVGQIAIGSTAETCAPINPATGVPYFSINPLAWGSGWAAGHCLRFNTEGANAPVWLIRSISPSDPFVGQDKVTLAVRGDIDA